MSGPSTIKMIQAFNQRRSPPMYLTGMFRSPPENFHNSEEVEFDIIRNGESISVPVVGSHGYKSIVLDEFTNKRFKPPMHRDQTSINAMDMLSREAGVNPFADQGFRVKMLTRATRAILTIEDGIKRSIELQASQIFQTGILSLKDENGDIVYTLDFGMRATHKITVGTAWTNPAADIIGDLTAGCDVIRNDSLGDPNMTIFGEDAFENAMTNTAFQTRMDLRRVNLGSIVPMREGGTGGGNFRGVLDLGNFKVDVWTYGGRYDDPQTGVKTQFIDPNNVVIRVAGARLDATFGAIPNFGSANQRDIGLPRRMRSGRTVSDLSTNVFTDIGGETLFASAGTRPLLIPTDIDSFANLDTIP